MIELKSRILLVDDLSLMRTMLQKSLMMLGYKDIDEAKDGAEAMKMIAAAHAENRPYGVVFLDWNMPTKTGIEVLVECRAQPEFSKLVIIMVTAEAEKKHVLRALMSGANDYIVKPISDPILRAKIDHINGQLSKKVG